LTVAVINEKKVIEGKVMETKVVEVKKAGGGMVDGRIVGEAKVVVEMVEL